jgi:HEPN domain-containing protein
MHDPRAEGRRWLEQAENDLAFARHALAGDFFHQVCFIAQQAAEKALKAAHFAALAKVLGHSVVGLLARLVNEHPGLEPLRDLAAELDLYYIPTRYPNGLVEGTPYQVFTRAQAERALSGAETVVAAVERTIAVP